MPDSRKTVPSGTAARSVAIACDARAVRARPSTRSPWPTPRRSRVDRRQLGALVRAQELQRRRQLDLRRRPDRAERAQAQRAVGRRRVRRRLEAERAGVGLRPGGGLLARRPAHAAPADLVERQARRRTPIASNSVVDVIGPVSTPGSWSRRLQRSASTDHSPRTASGRAIAGRRRCTRPSGCVIVPSFSA